MRYEWENQFSHTLFTFPAGKEGILFNNVKSRRKKFNSDTNRTSSAEINMKGLIIDKVTQRQSKINTCK